MLTAGTIISLELGHYRLREQIAGSAYGVIWRASGPRATQDVALKLVNEAQMAKARPEQRSRWIASAGNEIAFLQSLEPWDERHIVRLLDSGRHDGLPVLALELMTCDLGRHMGNLATAGEALPLLHTLDWLGQINQALAKVHQYGWRYLDLKPANLLLDLHLNTVKLADFGTSRPLGDVAAHGYAGTASWQAPEQFFPTAQGDYRSDARSDYFSLGALFYFLVSGGKSLRFSSACGQAYRDHHTEGAAVLRSRHGGAIPPTLLPSEEAAFKACIDSALDAIRVQLGDAGWRPAPSSEGSCADAALALLRTLLAADPAGRPGHAIEISRKLAAIRATLLGPQQVAMTELVQAVGRPSSQNGWTRLRAALLAPQAADGADARADSRDGHAP